MLHCPYTLLGTCIKIIKVLFSLKKYLMKIVEYVLNLQTIIDYLRRFICGPWHTDRCCYCGSMLVCCSLTLSQFPTVDIVLPSSCVGTSPYQHCYFHTFSLEQSVYSAVLTYHVGDAWVCLKATLPEDVPSVCIDNSIPWEVAALEELLRLQ